LCQSTDAAKEAAQHPQVKSAYIRDGSKYVQRGQTMVSNSFASTLLSPEISLQCLALIVVLLADVYVHNDNTTAQWHQSSLVKVLLLVYGLRMTWFLQHTSMPWTTLRCCAIWNVATLFVFLVQTFYPGKRGHARLGGDSRAEMVRLESQLAEKKVK